MKLGKDGRVSLVSFISASNLAIISHILLKLSLDDRSIINSFWWIHILQFTFLNVLIKIAFKDFIYQVSVRSILLGYTTGIGCIIGVFGERTWQSFGLYMIVLSTFHYSEFLAIAWTNPKAVSIDSFVLQHSLAYGIAAASSWIEFIIERYYYPDLKTSTIVSYFGLFMCIGGEVLRKLAMITASHNFNHILQTKKSHDHQLITHGVYQLCRHPSYVGWFYWSIGTQLILQNPFCLLAYTIASWRFFHDRVILEEITLLNFFDDQYVNYQKQVGTGLPFISGYRIDT
ncbi:hypothetical protein HCN44_007609 [Aphidius gifuensis]|uniref:Protein-S-isoprenylcysteine O-methyltransferase n=1 Tax=Aphidius gifuensis TaxID=684658 RepID=A0A835CPI2_APHGI|nr:protein-S-isoprenylcysteine O-methyltransferase [Aphidius gifuensis]KAF7988115.1 hypothetical protein HCN44_007609 [Aphidius gifuensis]